MTLVATGSEVAIALAAADLLAGQRIAAAVVSRPAASSSPRRTPPTAPAVLGDRADGRRRGRRSARAGSAMIGCDGAFVGMTGFGASAPAEDLYAPLRHHRRGGGGRRDAPRLALNPEGNHRWPSSPCDSFSTTPPSTATACRPSTSTTWSRASPSWRRRRHRRAGHPPGQPRRPLLRRRHHAARTWSRRSPR